MCDFLYVHLKEINCETEMDIIMAVHLVHHNLLLLIVSVLQIP